MTKLYRQETEVIQNRENKNVGNTGHRVLGDGEVQELNTRVILRYSKREISKYTDWKRQLGFWCLLTGHIATHVGYLHA